MTLKEIRAAIMEVVGNLEPEAMDKMLDLCNEYKKCTGRNMTFTELTIMKKEYHDGLDNHL